MISCGESFVTKEEWACTARQVHTRVIVFISRLKESTSEIGNIIGIIFPIIY